MIALEEALFALHLSSGLVEESPPRPPLEEKRSRLLLTVVLPWLLPGAIPLEEISLTRAAEHLSTLDCLIRLRSLHCRLGCVKNTA